jgi:hypothetical protein
MIASTSARESSFGTAFDPTNAAAFADAAELGGGAGGLGDEAGGVFDMAVTAFLSESKIPILSSSWSDDYFFLNHNNKVFTCKNFL